jgi:hypothetical protein
MTLGFFPPFDDRVALHIDFAAAFIAMVALGFSVWSFFNQKRISLEAMRIERDNDLIDWINAVIDTVVQAEFLMRSWTRALEEKEFSAKRDGCLAGIAAAIDKGRLFFPNFTLDVVDEEDQSLSREEGEAMLDHLVKIYDLINHLQAHPGEAAMKDLRLNLMKKKRDFVKAAQEEVKPERRREFVEGEIKRATREKRS